MRKSTSKSKKLDHPIPQVSVGTAFGGILKVPDIESAFELVKEATSVYKQDYDALVLHLDGRLLRIADRDQKLNFLLIVYGLALTNDLEDLFECVVKKIGADLGGYSSGYDEASERTDPEQRGLLELLLLACIVCGSVEQTYTTLAYGRRNTFLLRVTQDALRMAVELTDDNGPLGGDLAILKVLAENGAVLIPENNKKLGSKQKKAITSAPEKVGDKGAKPAQG